ncbi:hypothetical protein Ciccas_009919 [Cichlidogyrus casuarinus]|uniref:Fibronectin type-III domain-containing protein n=1 Tax=Cichlidogyrus casuarinus TaxID=1844966 RepID=A0ABD2PVL8_9PLAT
MWAIPDQPNGPIDGYLVEETEKRVNFSTNGTNIIVDKLNSCTSYTFQVAAFNNMTVLKVGGGNGPKEKLELKLQFLEEFDPVNNDTVAIEVTQNTGNVNISWQNPLPQKCFAIYSVCIDDMTTAETENEFIQVNDLEGNKMHSVTIAIKVNGRVKQSKYRRFNVPVYAPEKVQNLTCAQVEEGMVIECKWQGPNKLNGDLQHCQVQVSNGYSTQVKENRVLLKNMDGKRFADAQNYTIDVRCFTVAYGESVSTQIQTFQAKYSQAVMDKYMYDIGSNLNVKNSTLTLNFAEFGQTWSYDLQKITLYILNRRTNLPAQTCYQDLCQIARDPSIKCWEVTLQEGNFKNEIFRLVNVDLNGVYLQLRFYYKPDPWCWTASKQYQINSGT